MLQKIISIIYLFSICIISYAQSFEITNYNVSNTPQTGPGNNLVFDITQDKEGNFWFATGSGVSKFDGQNWNSFIHDSPYGTGQENYFTSIVIDTNSNVYLGDWGAFGVFSRVVNNRIEIINRIHIFDMIVDSLNYIWIASYEGLLKYKDSAFIDISYQHEMLSEEVFAIEIDQNGHIWAGTYNGVLYYNDTTWQLITTEDGLLDNYVFFMESDSDNNIWMLNTLGLSKYDGQNWKHYTTEDGLVEDVYWGMSVDHENNIYLSTEWNALLKFDGNEFTIISDTIGLAGNSVLTCYEDNNHDLWIGMWAVGVDKYDGATFTNYSGNSIDWIEALVYENNKLYIGTTRGGLSIFDGENWSTHNISNGFISNSVYSIDIDKEGNIWCATFWGLTMYDGENFTDYTFFDGLFGNSLTEVHIDNYNNVWIGFAHNGAAMYDGNTWTYYDTTNSLILTRVDKIIHDKNNCYWFATSEGGNNNTAKILSFDGETWESYQPIESRVRDILEDSRGNIWFGYPRSSLEPTIARFDGTEWETFKIEGTSNTGVMDIYEDKDSVIWFARNLNGCTSFDGENWVNYTYEDDGFPRASNRAITQDADGNMWVGTLKTGLYKFSRVTGIFEQQQLKRLNEFVIYPNPASDIISIKSAKEYISLKKAQLYNTEGKLLLEKEFHFDMIFDIQDLKSGVYIIKISNKFYNYSEKIIKK